MHFWLLLCFLLGVEAKFPEQANRTKNKIWNIGFVEDHPWAIKHACSVSNFSTKRDGMILGRGGGCIKGFLPDLFRKINDDLELSFTVMELSTKDKLLENDNMPLGLSPVSPTITGASLLNRTVPFIDGSEATKKYQTDKNQTIKFSLPIFWAEMSSNISTAWGFYPIEGVAIVEALNQNIEKLINQRVIVQLLEKWLVEDKNSWKKEKQLTKF